MAFFTAFFLGAFLFPPLISFLKRKKIEQSLRAKEEVRDLAKLHAAKANTPTMGGLCIWAVTAIVSIIFAEISGAVVAALSMFTIFCAIGLADDIAKFRSRSSRGVSGRRKLILEAIAVGAMVSTLRVFDVDLYEAIHVLCIPAMGHAVTWTPPTIFLLPFAFLVIAGSANGVNLTDGVDGLATGCSISAALALAVLCLGAVPSVSDAGELAVVLIALCGALLAFFCYNCQPAKIFMGDCGSLALGGLLGTVAMLISQPFLFAIIGGVFVVETLSVFMQVYYFKFSGGRRIFRMAPLHHHFELSGWPESRVVGRFWVAAIICAVAGLCLR
jgi:phospho-N-acetylmuramoyl-pentapeptide-transferase